MGVEGRRCLVGQNCKQALRIHPQAAGPAKGGWPSTWSSFSCQTVLTTWGPGHSLTVLTLHPHPSKPGALCSPLLPVPGQIPRPKPRRPVWGQQEKRGWEDNCGERAMVVQAARGRGDPGRPEARGSPPQPGRPLGPLAETGRMKGGAPGRGKDKGAAGRVRERGPGAARAAGPVYLSLSRGEPVPSSSSSLSSFMPFSL